MLEITERIEGYTGNYSTSLTLPFDQRQKSRLRVTLDNGNEASLILNTVSYTHLTLPTKRIV